MTPFLDTALLGRAERCFLAQRYSPACLLSRVLESHRLRIKRLERAEDIATRIATHILDGISDRFGSSRLSRHMSRRLAKQAP